MSDGISEYTPDTMSEYMSDRWGSLEESTVFLFKSPRHPRPTCETGCSKAHAVGGFSGYLRLAIFLRVPLSKGGT